MFKKKNKRPKEERSFEQIVLDTGEFLVERAAMAISAITLLKSGDRMYLQTWTDARKKSYKDLYDGILMTCIGDIYLVNEDITGYSLHHPENQTDVPEIARKYWEGISKEARDEILELTEVDLSCNDAFGLSETVRGTFDDIISLLEMISYGEDDNGAIKWSKEFWNRFEQENKKIKTQGLKGRGLKKAEEQAYIYATNTRIHLYDGMRRVCNRHGIDPSYAKSLEAKEPYLMEHEDEMEIHWKNKP